MSFKFTERPYPGKSFRPRPEIHMDEASRTLIVATPWGPRSAARKALARMVEYLSLARQDREATSPFQRLSCLSTEANNLRTAALLANEALYRDDNKREYRAGLELFAATLDDDELVWLQVGHPQVYLCRGTRSLMPLAPHYDLAFDFCDLWPSRSADSTMSSMLGSMDGSLSRSPVSSGVASEAATGRSLPSLPSQLLGLDSTIHLNMNSFRARPGDRLYLLSHSDPPEMIYSMKRPEMDILCGALSKTNPDQAFWLGLLEISETLSMSFANQDDSQGVI